MVKKSTLIKKKYYGRKKGKVIPLYGHKIARRIGRHRFFIQWKTTKKNLPGKTYYGKFYNTRKEAMTSRKWKKTRKRGRRKRRRRKRGGSECPPSNNNSYKMFRRTVCDDGDDGPKDVICCPPGSKCIKTIFDDDQPKRCSYDGDVKNPNWDKNRKKWYDQYGDLLPVPFYRKVE